MPDVAAAGRWVQVTDAPAMRRVVLASRAV